MPTTAIILAAGKSTRMKSARPKPLHEVCGKPMLGWILDACYSAGVTRALVVVGHAKDEIIERFGADRRITFVEQTQQLGTGHAARMCEPFLPESGDVFILAGDTPLLRGEILSALLAAHQQQQAAASMATAVLNDPTGYGRIVRDGAGEFVEIVEQIDATEAQAQIREVFPSYYCVKAADLRFALARLTNSNRKSEYYLTDIYAHLRQAGRRVLAVQAVGADDVIAPNTRQQLAEADAAMQQRIQRRLAEDGVTIIGGGNCYIEADVTIGAETMIGPFVYIGAGSRVGADCRIGPFAGLPRFTTVVDGATMAGNMAMAGGMSTSGAAFAPAVSGSDRSGSNRSATPMASQMRQD